MKKIGKNISASQDLLRQLYTLGVRDVVFCAGARNSPLMMALEKTSGFTTTSFFEERSAAFFAFGRARRDKRPAAVITTSGTAAAELLPAIIEAFHTGVPLIAVTADRPRRLRGTGAPQAIDQTGLFRNFVSCEIDVEAGEHMALMAWDRKRPLHLNICFDEPLLDGEVSSLDLSKEAAAPPIERSNADLRAGVEAFLDFIQEARTPVAVIGSLVSEEEKTLVEEFLIATKMPASLESTSGLRERPSLTAQALRAGDRILSWGLAKNKIDSVIRLGGVPTVRIWRDLDDANSKIKVFSMSSLPFAGLSRGTHISADLATVLKFAVGQLRQKQTLFDSPSLYARDREGQRLLQSLYKKEPTAEPSLVWALSKMIPKGAPVYVGNSLPIREWDLAADFENQRWVSANRGVNGIDGQLSTFLGELKPKTEGWALIGDLTAMYDLTAPWALKATNAKANFVVLNNRGGQIFTRIFKSSLFENAHAIEFSGWAKMWGMNYTTWSVVPSEWKSDNSSVIELVPDPEATKRFWDAHDEFWNAP